MSVLYDGAEYDINASTLYYIYRNEYSFNFDTSKPHKFSAKVARLLRMLIDEQGEDNAVEIVKFSCNNWGEIQRACKVDSMPTPAVIYGFRSTILGIMQKPQRNSVDYGRSNKKNTRVSKNELFIKK